MGTAPKNRKDPLDIVNVRELAESWAVDDAPLYKLTLAAWAMLSFAGLLRFSDSMRIRVGEILFHADRA